MKPEVSVIIPAYNTEAYLAKAIESALGQTLENIEVIVVDDASTDKTLEVAKSFNDKRLKVLANEKNLGAAEARNRALRVAKGKWIAVLDSDDWYAPERLEKLLAIAYSNNADMVADDINYIIDGEATPWSTLITQSGEDIREICQIDIIRFVSTDVYGQRGLHLGLSKPLLKLDFLNKHGIEYDPSLRMGQDFWLYIKCLMNGASYFLVPEAYYFYRSRPGSLIKQSQVERLNQSLRATQNFIQQEAVKNKPDLLRAMSYNLAIYQKGKAYYCVVEPLKQKKILTAFIKSIQHPYFFVVFINRLPMIIIRRFKYYILRDRLALEMGR
ncbi:glycosyltransferase family 2 protein [Nostoc sp. FACHB-110]|nr:glycosyltransferase family 2 protein [Nostoc sp. FACHB-110]